MGEVAVVSLASGAGRGLQFRSIGRLALCAAVCVAAVFLGRDAFSSRFEPVPPVEQAGWESDVTFPSDRLRVQPLEMDAAMRGDPDFYTLRSWRPEGGVVGALRSRSFETPAYLALGYTGFANEVPGNELVLVCEQTGGRYPLASARTNNQWSTIYVSSGELCSGPAKVELEVASAASYIGISTPFAVSAFDHALHTSFAPRFVVAAAVWLVFWSLAVLAIAACNAQAVYAAATGFIVCGATAMLVLLLTVISPAAGQLAGASVCIAAPVLLGMACVRPGRFRAAATASLPVSLLWLALALAGTVLVSIFPNGAGSWTVNGLFSPLRWSSDNQLPMLLAEAISEGRDPASIQWGPWLAADRTPLLSGGLLLVRPMYDMVAGGLPSSFLAIAYEVAAITILASWVVIVPSFVRLCGSSKVVVPVALLCFTPFAIFNTLYVWPKLLGAVFAALAFMLLFAARTENRRQGGDLILVAGCAALSYLSHASNAFVLVPIAVFYARWIIGYGLGSIVRAVVVAVILVSPWLWWTSVLQPGGNALLRFALAGTFGFEDRSVPLIKSVLDAYSQMSLGEWLQLKGLALLRLIGLGPDWSAYSETARLSADRSVFGGWRVLDFFELGRTILFPLLSLALVVAFWRDRLRRLAMPVAVGLAGVLVTVLLTLVPSYVHALPYGAVLLLMLSGGAALGLLPAVLTWSILCASAAYVVVVWIAPLHQGAVTVVWSNLAGVFAAAAVILSAWSWYVAIRTERHAT